VPISSGLARAVDRWGITLGEPYADVHPNNLVYRCTLRDGTAAVVKTEPDRGGEDEFLTGPASLFGKRRSTGRSRPSRR